MKKFALSLIASFAFIQSAYGATSALIESVLEYEAITNAIGSPDQSFISQNEFITDIKRLTKEINVIGEVKYRITTKEPPPFDWWSDERSCHSHHHHKHEPDYTHTCLATLLVLPNPSIGPNIVTVLSIVRLRN